MSLLSNRGKELDRRAQETISPPETLTIDNVWYWIPETRPLMIFTMHNKGAKKLINDAKKILEKKQIRLDGHSPFGNGRWIVENKKRKVTVYYSKLVNVYDCDCGNHQKEAPCKHVLATMAFRKLQ